MSYKNIKNSDWYFWGRWNEAMLFTEPWGQFYKTKIVKELDLKLKGYMKILHGNYYFLKEDLNKICQKSTKDISRKSPYFKTLFNLIDK